MFRKSSFIIVFHEAIPVGPAFDLKKFLFLNPPKKLLFISHPLLYNKLAYENSSWYEYYNYGKLISRTKAYHWILPELLHYIKDSIYTLIWCGIRDGKYDVFVGLNPLNALVGIFLRKIGKARKVVYYSIDYFPRRFENPLINKLYHHIDKLGVKFADETWNVSPNMSVERKKYHHDTSLVKKQFTVPIVAWRKKSIKRFDQIDKEKLVFVGLVDRASGVELIIRALSRIAKKIKAIKLDIIGGGPYLPQLKKLAKKFKVDSRITFYDWVTDRKRLEDLISQAAIGLVLFDPKIFGKEIKNADPMKIKDYMSLGLTIISTDAILTADEIEKTESGIIIRYKEDDLINAVVKLLGNEKLLKKYRENAVQYIKKFDAEKLYGDNLSRLLER